MTETKDVDIRLEDLLRSINIIYDAKQPERISHFQPTSKAVSLLKNLFGFGNDRAYFVSAPYGTGKSLVHTHLLHAIENTPNSFGVLKSIAHRISNLDHELSEWLLKRANGADKGIVLALQGFQDDLPKSIGLAIEASFERLGANAYELFFNGQLNFDTLDDAIQSIHRIVIDKDIYKVDRIVLIWDEFGRHLEELIAEGRSSDLNQLQTLAEYFSRSQEIPLVMSLMLHQSLMNYAGKVPQSVKKEWRKIEGRFETIQYIDDSKEIYQLIASVMSQIQHRSKDGIDFYKVASRLQDQGLFRDFSDLELPLLIEKSYPLDPIALFLLPRISSRIAQHERTLFTFLKNVDASRVIGLPEIYDYFSSSMSGDTSIGGTYHQWLESESAISKTSCDEEVQILKSACLLGIGITGHRQRTTKSLLGLAVSQLLTKEKSAITTIDNLINRKLLLYRKNSDSVSIWHGTDLDLFGKLQEKKDQYNVDFDALQFVKDLIEPKHWKSLEYNNKFCITRYFRGEYLDLINLKSLLSRGLGLSLNNEEMGISSFEDGRIFYLLPQTESELKEMEEILISEECQHDQVIFTLPNKPIDFSDMALEVFAYLQMQEDPRLIESDPLILPELQQLSDDATNYLQKMISLMTEPSQKGPVFHYKGKTQIISDSITLRKLLSHIMGQVFPYTPVLNNEMINRRNPRSSLVNARKKLCLSILEQAGEKDLLLEGFTPNVSFFRSLLLNTKLYRPISDDSDDQWHFVLPEMIDDVGLKLVWKEFQDFFTDEGEYKSLSDFFDSLKKPPFGLRDGILPILTSAALRAFPSALSITDKKGIYLPDILSSDIELIVSKPQDYKLSVKALTADRVDYLSRIIRLFDPLDEISIREKDLIRRAYDVIELWKIKLPKSSLASRSVSPQARRLQDILRKPLDPTHFLFKSIPSLFTYTDEQPDILKIVDRLGMCKREIDDIPQIYYKTAKDAMNAALQIKSKGQNPVIHNSKKWLSFFDYENSLKISDGTCRAFINRISNPYKADNQLLDSISGLLRGKKVTDWEDSDAIAFEKEVQEIVHRVEDFAMNTDEIGEFADNAKLNLAHLALNRMANLRDKMIYLVGESTTKDLLRDIIGDD